MLNVDAKTTLKLVQITDTHLNGPAEGHLLGMKTLESLSLVLKLVAAERTNFDAILVTGDLSQDHSERSYQHLVNQLTPFQRPYFWLAGNHDDPALMTRTAPAAALEKVIRSQHWQIILLNSQVLGAVHGQLSAAELSFLEHALNEAPHLHSLVCFHHHPAPMHSQWLDNIGLRNADELFTLLARHQNVRALLCGHVHQESDRTEQGIRILSTPSTCVQFLPHSQDFSIDTAAPGYRFLELHHDGRIETQVSRVQGIEFEIDFSVKGY